MTWSELAELLNAVLTWPVAIIVVVFLFRVELRDLVKRIATVKFPGGELQTRQTTEPPSGKGVVNPPPPNLPANLVLGPEQQETLRQFIQSEQAAARLWEYRFLNLFLVRRTQIVLDWFVGLGQASSLTAYEAYWIAFITDAEQRATILRILTSHHLVEQDGPLLVVSEKGKEYAKWRGQVPPLPPPASPPDTL